MLFLCDIFNIREINNNGTFTFYFYVVCVWYNFFKNIISILFPSTLRDQILQGLWLDFFTHLFDLYSFILVLSNYFYTRLRCFLFNVQFLILCSIHKLWEAFWWEELCSNMRYGSFLVLFLELIRL
jgi:hypothetical protein